MKRALVIGASRSLGIHLASTLAANGWKVVGTGRRPADEVPQADTFDYVRLDLSRADEVRRFMAETGAGGYDLIVHNAVTYGSVQGNPVPGLDELETMFRVNTLVPYQMLHRLLSAQPADRFCSCVVINSDAIYHANKNSAPYAATKAALRVLTTSLADTFRSTPASVATLVLGPLPDPKKLEDFEKVSQRHGLSVDDVTRTYLRKSNPSYVIDRLIDFESCYRSVEYLAGLGPSANGMVCRLDGGSAGSLI
ncbi:SDR family oxidoreductase [Streptomyces longwoodensis]|uniref:SDR family NAD(P)-dependent oxidoreductase n=1 Tax=Streptomyces longwoodensis TaxID=68231 RepID=UPI002DD9B45D|nr:SDR family oxidoreductase [Streptomyces longwoodensis]WRY92747.1 SDR family oxidoreductase [Streptomyces longwoodensis]